MVRIDISFKWQGLNSYKLATSEEFVTSRFESTFLREIERWAYIKDFEVTCEQHQQKQIDWEQRRYDIAQSAMIGVLASPIVDGIDPNPSIEYVAHHSVLLADALIKELKQQDNEITV